MSPASRGPPLHHGSLWRQPPEPGTDTRPGYLIYGHPRTSMTCLLSHTNPAETDNIVLQLNITSLVLPWERLSTKTVQYCLQPRQCAWALLFLIVKLIAHHFPLCDKWSKITCNCLCCLMEGSSLSFSGLLVLFTPLLRHCGRLLNTDSAGWMSYRYWCRRLSSHQVDV